MANNNDMNHREVFQLHIGSAGIEIGHRCWELYCLEHSLTADGNIVNGTEANVPPKCFFSEKKNYRPRALFIDSNCSTMDTVKSSKYRNLYSNDQFHLLANNSLESVLDTIRKQIEDYDNFDGFIISHAMNGQCSSFTSELLQKFASDYTKKTIVTNSIFGSSIDVSSMYNLLELAHVVTPMENKAIFNLCKHRLEIANPAYANMNRLIATCWSNITCSMRFKGSLLTDLNEFQTALIPFPTMKIISSFLLPLIPFSCSTQKDFKSPSVYDMCVPLFSQAHTCFVHQSTPYKMLLSATLHFRGENIIPKEIGQKLIIAMKQWWRFSDTTPTGFKCGINYCRPYIFDDDSDIALTDKQVCALVNEMATSKYICEIALNQSSNTQDETAEVNEANDFLQGLKSNYQELESEIINANELNLATPFK
ncbi:unnamed protein product [Rotaria socialis]|uniref:Tubulin/FtsZ GTPase domain-containing protein n=1 Tax=Rotaria socialis TaxID=392032 RepID=A0A818HS67_9BILA|nr:unnamed protein product [Rotaria socialis]CAF4664442.1 unnamed protein product [Rotaria socialis]